MQTEMIKYINNRTVELGIKIIKAASNYGKVCIIISGDTQKIDKLNDELYSTWEKQFAYDKAEEEWFLWIT